MTGKEDENLIFWERLVKIEPFCHLFLGFLTFGLSLIKKKVENLKFFGRDWSNSNLYSSCFVFS